MNWSLIFKNRTIRQNSHHHICTALMNTYYILFILLLTLHVNVSRLTEIITKVLSMLREDNCTITCEINGYSLVQTQHQIDMRNNSLKGQQKANTGM